MERNDQNLRNRDDLRGKQEPLNASQDENDDILESANEDISGNDLREEEKNRVRHHQAHGIRHYESFRNHSSADDQPMTDTGA